MTSIASMQSVQSWSTAHGLTPSSATRYRPVSYSSLWNVSGFSGDFAVAVPLEAVRGAARRVSVGDYEAELEFPIK